MPLGQAHLFRTDDLVDADAVEEGLVEKRRGLGMFVCEGARRKLIASERAKFLHEEWPAVLSRIEQLGLSIDELLPEVRHKENSSR